MYLRIDHTDVMVRVRAQSPEVAKQNGIARIRELGVRGQVERVERVILSRKYSRRRRQNELQRG